MKWVGWNTGSNLVPHRGEAGAGYYARTITTIVCFRMRITLNAAWPHLEDYYRNHAPYSTGLDWPLYLHAVMSAKAYPAAANRRYDITFSATNREKVWLLGCWLSNRLFPKL